MLHERFLEEAFGAESESSRVRKSVRADHESEVSSSSDRATTSEVVGQGRLGPPANKTWVEKWRKDLKIASRQFHRLIEMLVLLRLDPTDRFQMRAYRLQVKERLYRFNFEILAQLEQHERYEKLEETFGRD